MHIKRNIIYFILLGIAIIFILVFYSYRHDIDINLIDYIFITGVVGLFGVLSGLNDKTYQKIIGRCDHESDNNSFDDIKQEGHCIKCGTLLWTKNK